MKLMTDEALLDALDRLRGTGGVSRQPWFTTVP
jgi:hypothetical protein